MKAYDGRIILVMRWVSAMLLSWTPFVYLYTSSII
jgi:hypothetical protein